jgi:hypothetical protein
MGLMNARRLVSRFAVARWSRFARVLCAGVAALVVLAVAGTCLTTSAFAGEGYGVRSTFGTAGAGNGELAGPLGVAVNQESGDVYVTDSGNRRVEYFSGAGVYAGQFNGAGNLSNPTGFEPASIAIDNACFYHGLSEPECAKTYPSNGDVYVLDRGNGVLDKFSASGSFISQIGPLPFFDKNFASVAVDSSGNVWVAEGEYENNVSEYSETGFETGTHEQQFSTFGGVSGVAVDADDNVYLKLEGNRLGKFNAAGVQQAKSETEAIKPVEALAVDLATNDLFLSMGENIAQYGPFGEPFSAPLYSSGAHAVPGLDAIAVNSTSHAVYASSFSDNDVAILEKGPQPATPSTEAPSGVGPRSATFHGTLTLEAAGAIEYYFEYNTGALCAGGTKTAAQSAPKGPGTLAVSATVSNELLPDQSYTVCLVASNENGPSAGTAITFPTVAVAPEVIASSASVSGVTPFGAHVEALVNPNNQTSTCEVQYGKTTAYGGSAACEPASLEGFSEAGQSVGLTIAGGLEPATTYHYRFVAKNATGSSEGTGAFMTSSLKKPFIQEERVAAEGPFEAGLQAEVNPEYQETTCVFEYATSEAAIGKAGQATTVACPTALGKGGAPVGPSTGEHGELLGPWIHISGLTANTPYYYRVIATNATGTEDGTIEEYKTPALEAPSVLFQSTLSTTGTTASVEAYINPKYQETSCHVEYGVEPLLLSGVSSAPCEPEQLGDGDNFSFVSPPTATLTGLEPRTVYYYRFVAENAAHEKTQAPEIGPAIETFTTLGAVTGAAQEVTRTSATVGGSVYPGGAETGYHFVYIEQKQYEEAVADGAENPYAQGYATGSLTLTELVEVAPGVQVPVPVVGGYAAHAVTPVQITGLHAGVTYDYALVATHTEGVAPNVVVRSTTGPSETFTTSAPTPPTITGVSAVASSPSTASIAFTLEPRGLPTRWELRLGTSPSEMVYRASGSSASSEAQAFTVSLEKLSGATTYYYEVTAVNSDNQVNPQTHQPEPVGGPEATFATPPAPIPPGLQPLTPIALLQVPAVAAVKEGPGSQPPAKKAGKCVAGKKREHGNCSKTKITHQTKRKKARRKAGHKQIVLTKGAKR